MCGSSTMCFRIANCAPPSREETLWIPNLNSPLATHPSDLKSAHDAVSVSNGDEDHAIKPMLKTLAGIGYCLDC